VARLPTRNAVFRAIWTADSYVSSTLFEVWDGLCRGGSAYGSFLYRHFKMTGPKRYIIDLIDDFVTFGVVASFAILAYALPPWTGQGDIYNRGRNYAMTFTDADGNVIGQRGIRQDDAIPLAEIPPVMINAALATEDARFFEHFGVDVIGTLRAAVHNARNKGSTQGGSSITQQVVKNLFLTPEKSLQRKIHEAFLSIWLEAHLSKKEILKLYLDRSYLGGGNYGVEAASQFYFGKSVRDITLPEAAILAGLFKAPANYAPHQHPEAAHIRASVVLRRMLDAGFITQGELLHAERKPAEIVQQHQIDAPDWFLDWAYRDTLQTLQKYNLMGEYVVEVKTTIDSKLQRVSQQVVNDAIAQQGEASRFSQGATFTMDLDGAVKSIVGGKDYAESLFNRATDGKRQTGSAFKPFVYLAALLNGYTPDTKIVDGPVSVGNWTPSNFHGGFHGSTTLSNALAHSYNSVPVKLSKVIGLKAITQTAHDCGIRGELDPWAPMVLGTSSLTLMDMTTAYATFATGGKLTQPYAVLEIKRPTGMVVYSRAANSAERPQVEPADKIAELNTMLKAVVKDGTAKGADLGFAPQAGKTGTNQDLDAWFIGFTAHYITGVWIGNDDNSLMHDVTGGKIPAPMWKSIMLVAEEGKKPEALPGIPLDETYTPPPVDVAAVTPQVLPADTAVGAEEASNAPSVDPATDPAQDVLDGLVSLFDKSSPSNAGWKQAQKKKIARLKQTLAKHAPSSQSSGQQAAQTAPKRRSFFDKLFGRDPPPKPKRKTLFGF
jgi:penicillin-binding protein 1A